MKLKDFQKATVKHAVKQLKKNNRFLVADEVGLGKTIIARGVIEHLYNNREDKNKPFHVVYICSNQVLAQQNIRKLSIEGSDIHSMYSRLMLMVKENNNKSNFQISTLTPATSFRMTNSKGIAEERAILYYILSQHPKIKNKKLSELRNLLQGDCGDESWEWWIDTWQPWVKLRPGIIKSVHKKLQQNGTFDVLLQYFESLEKHKTKDYIVQLRKTVTDIAIDDCLKADLFILDEFQRFSDLIKTTGNNQKEPNEIQLTASKIFNDNKKVLLLSATPFKQFATQWDVEQGNNHFESFNELLKFLFEHSIHSPFNAINTQRKSYLSMLQKYRDSFQELVENKEFQEVRKKLHKLYLKGLTRTERAISVKTPLINDKSKELLLPTDEEVLKGVNLLSWLSKEVKTRKYTHQMIEFCKSTPHPFSFIRGYKLHEDLLKLKKNKDFYLPYDEWNSYNYELNGRHAKLDSLLKTVFKQNSVKLLWIPPSLPYYKISDQSLNSHGYSKTLIFSSWVMVPRALSTLLSYHAEKAIQSERSEQKYFPKIKKSSRSQKNQTERRKPLPRLVFRSQVKDESNSNATLIYPCAVLADSAKFNSSSDIELSKLQDDIVKTIADFLPLERHGKASDIKHWYWDSLFLLDKECRGEDNVVTWLRGTWLEDINEDDEDEPNKNKNVKGTKGKEKFIEALRKVHDTIDDSDKVAPQDILNVLSEIALGSPAVCAYRTLNQLFPDSEKSEKIENATRIAIGFLSLFNKPESIMIIDSFENEESTESYPFWRKCLRYSISLNIQAMVDEYLFLLKENSGVHEDINGICRRFVDSVSVRTSNIDVELMNSKIERRGIRCHFAVDYGSQNITSEKGKERMVSVRDVFNSPFRPFVLTSTSLGQEGLDFHQYCRNIYHWNLPHNPIDLEQREGRINRYLSHAIRLNFKDMLTGFLCNNWENIIKEIEKLTSSDNSCDLIPFWHLNEQNKYKINRYVPLYNFSKDKDKYDYFLKILSFYRLTFGQPNQEQVLAGLLEDTEYNIKNMLDILKKVTLSLAPIMEKINS